MDRVTNLAATRLLMSYLGDTRRRVDDLQGQLASGTVSRDYAGLAGSSDRLVGLESAREVLTRFTATNDRAAQRLAIVETALTSFREVVNDVRFALVEFAKTVRTDATDVRLMQEHAFKAMESLEALLNTEYDGRYLFAGSKVRTEPVDFGLTTLADFQARYDGTAVTYPTTRDAHLANVALAHADTGDLTFDRATNTITATSPAAFARIPVGAVIEVAGTGANNDRFTVLATSPTVLTLRAEKLSVSEAAPAAILTAASGEVFDAAATGGLTVDAAAGTVTAAAAGSLAALAAGTTFTLAGAPSPANDGTYTVLSNDGTTLAIVQHALTDEAPAPNTSTITIQPYYRGDSVDAVHRVDTRQSIAMDLNAVDPVFEKAVRALAILAQGAHGTEGGLDAHPERVDQALHLITSALEQAVGGTPPFGPETEGSLPDLQTKIGLQRVLLADTNERLAQRLAALENEIAEIESVDDTETSVRLFDQINALETSLATIARVQQLNLLDFLR